MKKLLYLTAFLLTGTLYAQHISTSGSQTNGDIYHLGGDVGIGGTPVSKLDVGNFQNGSISNQVVLRLRNTIAENQPANWGSAIEFYNMSNNITNSSLQGAKIISEASQYGWSHNLKFRVFQNNNFQNQTGIDAMTINTNGNVGIGTTNPDEKLTVKGTIHTEEVRVDLSVPAPDYVFEENYDLRSLKDTETYINKNKHLPEIPSAKEMEANGVELGDMNMLLLKKIEELTLYTIEQQKLLNTQKEQLSKQKESFETQLSQQQQLIEKLIKRIETIEKQ